MRKFNYRVTVNINDTTLKLGLRCRIPDDYLSRKVRVQAIFMQRRVERRFPMDVFIVEEENGPQVMADAEIELPYVFVSSPRHNVNVTFALWLGMEENILNDQPFPVQKELFARNTQAIHKNVAKFVGSTIMLPAMITENYLKDKDKTKALKDANKKVYETSGYSFSPRQKNTDYFVAKYEQFCKKLDVKKKNVLFLSERLPEQGGNLQRVMEAFEADPEISVSQFIVTKTVDALSKKELKECARLCSLAHAIILEDFYPQLHALKIRPQTKVIQLWHACGAFKTFGFSRLNKPGGAPQSSMNHRNYDLVPVSSDAIRGIYAEAFGINSTKVKALGVPRTDVLFDENYKMRKSDEIYKKYPEMFGKKVVLFAPTFRGDGNKDAYYPEDAFDVNRFMEGLPENVFCIVKHHPFVHQTFEVEDRFKDRVLDLTGKDHINDLMLIADLLITDYSSSVFEAAVLNLPMLFYVFDKEEYIKTRDFYCDFDSFAPGYIESDFEAMTRRTASILRGVHDRREKRFIDEKREQFSEDFLSALDGKSTVRVAAYIKEHMLLTL